MNLVEKALELYPETRSDDKKLILTVWWLQDREYTRDFVHFFQHKAISPETIRRRRQLLQEKGQYKATEKVEENRYNLFKQNRWSRGAVVAEEIM